MGHGVFFFSFFTGCCGIYTWAMFTLPSLEPMTRRKLGNLYAQHGGEENLLTQAAEPQLDTCHKLVHG